MNRLSSTAVATALAILCAGCGGSSSTCTPRSTGGVPAATFAGDVYPIFSEAFATAAGTQHCVDCHTPGSDAGMVPFSGSPSEAYTIIRQRLLVDTSAPQSSKLYQKPSGLDVTHPGGKLFDPTSREAQAILSWVGACAPND